MIGTYRVARKRGPFDSIRLRADCFILSAFAVRCGVKQAILAAFALLMTCAFAFGQNFRVLHSFAGPPNDGAHPVSDLAFDSKGNLYGTTPGGGNSTAVACSGNGCGTVFMLSPNGKDEWTETVIYSFCSDFDGQLCLDGAYSDAGLLIDSSGNLYGTTSEGGMHACSIAAVGCGAVFELSPPTEPGAAWTETVLYSFCNDFVRGVCLDGEAPDAQLILDTSGNLYGTTAGGGAGHSEYGAGTVFELTPSVQGWRETVLYSFCTEGNGDICPDGYGPVAGVTFDAFSNLYGTTYSGGSQNTAGSGTVYELLPDSEGWKEKVVLTFGPTSGNPQGIVTYDRGGNLYTTYYFPHGGVVRLKPKSRKGNQFAFNGVDGQGPIGGVHVDAKTGAVYGTTSGDAAGPGNIFKISAGGIETVLHVFCSWPNCNDGEISWSLLTADKAGNLYGTTEFGGEFGAGVVFEITP